MDRDKFKDATTGAATLPKITVTAECPYCDRSEELDDELTARAWATGHIQEEHDDQLPEFSGVE